MRNFTSYRMMSTSREVIEDEGDDNGGGDGKVRVGTWVKSGWGWHFRESSPSPYTVTSWKPQGTGVWVHNERESEGEDALNMPSTWISSHPDPHSTLILTSS